MFRGLDPTVGDDGSRRPGQSACDNAIIRTRAKVTSTVGNAMAFRALQAELGSVDAYLWD